MNAKTLPFLLTGLLLVGCNGPTVDQLAGDVREAYVAFDVAQKEALAKLEVAKAENDTEEVQKLEAIIEKAEEHMVAIEQEVSKEQLTIVGDALSLIPGVAPYANAIEPLVLPMILPFLGKRSRRHIFNAAKKVAPGVPNPDGTRGIQLLAAANDLLKALGLKHSSEESAKAANATT